MILRHVHMTVLSRSGRLHRVPRGTGTAQYSVLGRSGTCTIMYFHFVGQN